MSLPIFYIAENDPGNFITLDEATSRHVVQVLRMKAGEALQLTDGKGHLITTQIAEEHKKKCTVKVVERAFKDMPLKKVSIAISILKNVARFEWFLEKATELGVTEIVPLICSRTEKQYVRFERMQHILIAAMLQSQQTWLPILHQPTEYNKAVAACTYDTKLVAHCLNEEKNSLHNYHGQPSVQVLIGPEGDFSKEEIGAALALHYQPVTLGNTRLRTETAGVVAAALLCV